MRTKLLTIQIFILFLSSVLLLAQDNKAMKEKLKNIEGDVNKIVVSTDKGDVVFEGEEAKQLLKRMKAKKMHKKIEWISDEGEDFEIDGENVMIFKSEGGEKHIIKHLDGEDNVMIIKHGDNDDIDILEDGKMIKVNVEVEDGEKQVTVTTTEDGEEKVEIFEGKEADEYLEKMKDEHDTIIDIDVEVDSDGEHVWVHQSGDKKQIEKDVKVELEDGKKKVTVTTKKDGKETVEVYEGDEADEFLENEHGGKKLIKIKESKDGKKHKKIIIKEIKKEIEEEEHKN